MQLGEVRTWHEEDGSGEPLVLLHPMTLDTIAFLKQVVGGPAYLVGHSDGAPVAIDLDEETTAFFVAYHGEVSPDGPGYFPVIADKLYRMHSEEPTLTDADEDARYLVGKTTVTHYQVVDQIEDSSGPSEEP